eukprot:m.149475 g.149475  ORF g.149475 m.149475 type:complete len:252 (-) comp15012_c0_seq5:1932-2687(-)
MEREHESSPGGELQLLQATSSTTLATITNTDHRQAPHKRQHVGAVVPVSAENPTLTSAPKKSLASNNALSTISATKPDSRPVHISVITKTKTETPPKSQPHSNDSPTLSRMKTRGVRYNFKEMAKGTPSRSQTKSGIKTQLTDADLAEKSSRSTMHRRTKKRKFQDDDVDNQSLTNEQWEEEKLESTLFAELMDLPAYTEEQSFSNPRLSFSCLERRASREDEGRLTLRRLSGNSDVDWPSGNTLLDYVFK